MMLGRYFFYIIVWLQMSLIGTLCAQTQSFEVQSALNELNQLSTKSPIGKTKRSYYENAISTLSEQMDQAEECVVHAKKELTIIKSLLSEAESLEGESLQADLIYLKKQQTTWIKTQSLCRLYLLKANEQIIQFKKNVIQLKEQTILLKNEDILTLYSKLISDQSIAISSIFYQIINLCSEQALSLSFYVFVTLFILTACLMCFRSPHFNRFLSWMHIPSLHAKYIVLWIMGETFIIDSLTTLNDFNLFPPLLWTLIEMIFVHQIGMTMMLFSFFYLSRRLFLISTPLIFTPMGLSLIGYVNLSIQCQWTLFFTSFILLSLVTLLNLIDKTYQSLYTQPKLKIKLITLFGYRPDQTFIEYLILKITLQCLVCVLAIFLMIKNSGFTNEALEFSADRIITGISIGHLTLYPLRIALGTCFYCILYLGARALSTKVTKQYQTEAEEETQVAIASLINYGGFSIAVILGALIAEFDFTGLAIIAGALSVGIGFGLQSIVNNFVSGLILLIEKPIKPGDKIRVNGIEGMVKKIRVRSTHLINSAREDIIIPNSDLMTQQVTNYMLTDKYCYIFLDVGVAYGTSTHKVKDTLLAIALKHPEIIKTEKNKPTVLLTAFEDSALNFQLQALIKDTNKKGQVLSDLRFEIDTVFQEKNINMPYPQREVHVSFTPSSSTSSAFSHEPLSDLIS